MLKVNGHNSRLPEYHNKERNKLWKQRRPNENRQDKIKWLHDNTTEHRTNPESGNTEEKQELKGMRRHSQNHLLPY